MVHAFVEDNVMNITIFVTMNGFNCIAYLHYVTSF